MLAGRSVLRRLKDATAELHVEAERYVRILDAGATVDDYRRYLRAMHGFHAPVEVALARDAALAAAGFAPASRCVKAAWLRADLAALGEGGEPPACADVPAGTTLPRAIGIAYVLEGATLGGRFVLAKLPPVLAALRGTATRFLDGYGGETGARWRAFGALVEGAVTCAADTDAAVGGARATFATLIAWLARHEVRGALPGAVAREAS